MKKGPARSAFDLLGQAPPPEKKKKQGGGKKKAAQPSRPSIEGGVASFFAPRPKKKAVHPHLLAPPRGDDTTTVSRVAFERSLGMVRPERKPVVGGAIAVVSGPPRTLLSTKQTFFRPAMQHASQRAPPPRPPQPGLKPEKNERQLNPQQRAVVNAPPDQCAVVTAGAGSGKTHSIVQRVRALIERGAVSHGREVLLMTFSNKAAAELCDRVDALFDPPQQQQPSQQSQNKSYRHHGVVTKTFHGLSYAWLGRYHQWLNFTKRPTPITDAGKKRLIKAAVEKAVVEPKRIGRCARELLGKNKVNTSIRSWADVLTAYEARDKVDLDRLRAKAKTTVLNKQSTAAAKKKKKKQKESKAKKKQKTAVDPNQRKIFGKLENDADDADADEDDDDDDDESSEAAEAAIEAETRRLVYMRLTNQTKDDLIEKHLKGDNLKEYQKFIEKATLRGDTPGDYLAEEAAVLRQFDALLVKDNVVTFDRMLQHMETLLRDHEPAQKAFAARHRVVIVDEFQDNNPIQSRILNLMLDAGCRSCMCVGDDDQAIYSFQGADIGNFDRFELTCCQKRGQCKKIALEFNYRSSLNVVTVGRAFVPQSTKVLRATKPQGDQVSMMECYDQRDQAKHIVDDLLHMKNTRQIPLSEMAVLFRCFKAGSLGRLHYALQRELGDRRVPFIVVGATSLFQQKLAQDILAYLSLTVDENSVAFARVFNSPKRRLSDKVLAAVDLVAKSKSCSLEQAANDMVNSTTTHVPCVLSNAQKTHLRGFLKLLGDLRKAALKHPLDSLVDVVWDRAGFAAAEQKKADKREQKRAKMDIDEDASDDDDDDDDDDDQDDDDDEEEDVPVKVDDTDGGKKRKQESDSKPSLPDAAAAIMTAAETFAESWKKDHGGESDPHKNTLFGLAAKCAIERAAELPFPAEEVLPPHLLELLTSPRAIGPGVVAGFVANIALQAGTADEEEPDEDRVVLSTIHRAKGKEWQVVCVPFFNEGLMPCEFRPDEEPRGGRHTADCTRRFGAKSCTCQQYFAQQEIQRPEDKHYEEERRLAHVAATRAKDWLRFYKLQFIFPPRGSKDDDKPTPPAKPSRFEADILENIHVLRSPKAQEYHNEHQGDNNQYDDEFAF